MTQGLLGRWRSFVISTTGDDVRLDVDDIMEITDFNRRTGVFRGTHRGRPISGHYINQGASFSLNVATEGVNTVYEGSLAQSLPHAAEKNVLVITGRRFVPPEVRARGKRREGEDELRFVDDQEQATWVATKQG